jgi:LemA protein
MIGWIIGGAMVFVLLIIIGSIVGIYNTLVTAFQDIKNQWSNVLTEYQRRADLFMNLVESVKAYTKFEKTTLEEVTKARSGQFGGNQASQAKQLKKLDSIFAGMKITIEKYPDLKAGKLYSQFMDDVRETEDRVNIARTDFNELVRNYNIYVKQWPTSIFANMFGYSEYKYFEAEQQSMKAPKVDFN